MHVNLLRRDEDYTPPAQPRVRAFTGTGYKLTADDAGGAGPSTAAGPTTEVTPGAVTWEGADPAQPTTSIQLRLADGSRLRAEFNLSHTVADIRRCGRGLGCASLWPEACHCRQHQHAMLWTGLLLALVASFVIWLCASPLRAFTRAAGSSAPPAPTPRAARIAWPLLSLHSSWTMTLSPLRRQGWPTAWLCRRTRSETAFPLLGPDPALLACPA